MVDKKLTAHRKNEESKSLSTLWREFFEYERAFLDYIKSNGNIQRLEYIEGYEPEYKKYRNEKGRVIDYAPRTIRCIYHAPESEMQEISSTVKELSDLYKKARKEHGDSEDQIELPPRFPQILRNVEKIHVGVHKAHRSVKVDPEKDLVLIKRKSKEYTGKVDSEVEMIWAEIIHRYSQHRVHAYIEDDKLMVCSKSLLKHAEGCDIQFRVATGTAYTVWIYQTDKPRFKRAYGFLICDTIPEIIAVNTMPTPVKKIESIGRKLEFDFLPDNYSLWAKTPKKSNKS